MPFLAYSQTNRIITETKFMEMTDLKKAPYEKLNPNGRVPCIVDPNHDVVLWESGAILEYLCDTYDKEHTLSYGNKFPENYQCKQWLFFQVSPRSGHNLESRS